MKFINYGQKFLIAIMASALAFSTTACSDDDDDDEVTTTTDGTTTSASDVTLTSVTYGDETLDASSSLTFTFTGGGSSSVTFNYSGAITYLMTDYSKIKTTGDITVTGFSRTSDRTGMTISFTVSNAFTAASLTMPNGFVGDTNNEAIAGATVNFNAKEAVDASTISTTPVQATSASAQKLYTFLLENYGSKTISGMMSNAQGWNTELAEEVGSTYGKTPLIAGFDFLHLSFTEGNAGWFYYTDITPVQEWAANGGIVTINWHWNVPTTELTSDELADLDKSLLSLNRAGNLSYGTSVDFNFVTALDDATSWDAAVYEHDMAAVIKYLTLLKDADIPVLWRPYHEASGAWFWWGAKGATAYKRLWIDMFERFAAAGLDNIIWVWTSQTDDLDSWYPGDEYVDIVGTDIYGDATGSCLSKYQILSNSLAKIITLSECGYSSYTYTVVANISTQMAAGCSWSWFMPWYDGDTLQDTSTSHAPASWWQDAVATDNILWLGDYE